MVSFGAQTIGCMVGQFPTWEVDHRGLQVQGHSVLLLRSAAHYQTLGCDGDGKAWRCRVQGWVLVGASTIWTPSWGGRVQ